MRDLGCISGDSPPRYYGVCVLVLGGRSASISGSLRRAGVSAFPRFRVSAFPRFRPLYISVVCDCSVRCCRSKPYDGEPDGGDPIEMANDHRQSALQNCLVSFSLGLPFTKNVRLQFLHSSRTTATGDLPLSWSRRL